MSATPSDLARTRYMQTMISAGIPHVAGPDSGHATGPAGECWSNAQALARQDPARYAYVEGIVRRTADDRWEMHGYVLDCAAGHVIETTAGYAGATDYQGLPLAMPAVDAWFTEHPEDEAQQVGSRFIARSSVLWLALYDAAEAGQ